MKKIILIVLILLGLTGILWAEDKECSDCPIERPCEYSKITHDDGCNTCTCNIKTWCEDEKWWMEEGMCTCTLRYCPKIYQIENPFKD